MFAGEAYNVEIGVSNELFPNLERTTGPGCEYDAGPKDATNILNPVNNSTTGTASEMSSDIVNFAAFSTADGPTGTGEANGFDAERAGDVQQHRMRTVPLRLTDFRGLDLHGHWSFSDLITVLGFCRAPYGHGIGRWSHPGETPGRINSAPRPCGEWVNAYSSCMTGVRRICWRRFGHTKVPGSEASKRDPRVQFAQ